MDRPVGLLLADDHRLFRQGLRKLLADHPRWRVVGEAEDAREVMRYARSLRPDIVLMDLYTPGGSIEAISTLRAELPDVAVVILTASDEREALLAALRAGARGYLLKTTDFDQLLQALETIAAGQAALAPEISTQLLLELRGGQAPARRRRRAAAGCQLSARELEILPLLAQGASNRRIAGQLCLSENTVRTHLAHILEKLGLDNRVQAAAYALRHRLAS